VKVSPTLLLAALALAGCGERSPDPAGGGSTTPPYVRAEEDSSLLNQTVTAVRIGEAGPNFAACTARGTTRDRTDAGPMTVRAAPFEPAEQIDRLEPGAQFFICARSHDQRWLGIVYDEGGQASARCGVSAPIARRRDYPGPCAAGWVDSARVRQVSGIPPQPSQAAPLAPEGP